MLTLLALHSRLRLWQAFVAGDPRGHRLAKVLRVQRSDEDFPIRVETQEMCVSSCPWSRHELGLTQCPRQAAADDDAQAEARSARPRDPVLWCAWCALLFIEGGGGGLTCCGGGADAKWRKLRTFRLVDGEVEGETRAQRLNAGLKKVAKRWIGCARSAAHDE
jgi:hypothetical protein